jgi:dipeptidase E
MKKMCIASTSTLFGETYLRYLENEIKSLFKGKTSIVFVPFARPGGSSHDQYTALVHDRFANMGIEVKGLHRFDNFKKAIEEAEGIFVGGGNTFLLVTQLYQYDLMTVLRRVIQTGTPYLGSSAGSNICGLTMQTTNDMPIVLPPSEKTLQILPFNINPHYIDVNEQSKHMGETRETRIREFQQLHNIDVLGLREGSWLSVKGEDIELKGSFSARLFKKGEKPTELTPGKLNYLAI